MPGTIAYRNSILYGYFLCEPHLTRRLNFAYLSLYKYIYIYTVYTPHFPLTLHECFVVAVA